MQIAVDSKATQAGCVPLRWVAVVFVLLAAFVYLTGLTASPDNAGIAYQTFAGLALAAVFSGIMLFCVWGNRRYVGRPILGWPGWRKFLLEAVIAIPIAIALSYAMSAVVRLSPQLMRAVEVSNRWDIYGPVIIAPALYCLVGCVAPVAEEMLYRAVLYRSLRPWMRPIFAIVLQALLFGLMHPFGLVYMSIAFAGGLLFMALYLWRRTLWSPVLVHWLLDATGGAFLLVAMLSASGKIMLGVFMDDVSNPREAEVTTIFPGSLAEQANVKVGDIIAAIDHQPIHQASDVTKNIRGHKSGDVIHLTLLRQGRTLDIPIALRALRPHILW